MINFSGVDKGNIWVYLVDLKPDQMIEYGEILPKPGQESVWLNALPINLQKKSVNKAIKFVKMGNVKAAANAIQPAINELIKMKCKKIILGCTELPIAIFAFKSFSNIKSSKLFLDPNLILANSAMSKHKS